MHSIEMPEWLAKHRDQRSNQFFNGMEFQGEPADFASPVLTDRAFNDHHKNDGSHVSPYDNGVAHVGTEGLQVKLIQGIDEEQFKRFLAKAARATTGWAVGEEPDPEDADEMMRGGLQSGLESQVVIFEVTGASRALTHQLVRSRRAAFHQQSQRATWYGDQPDVRMPLSVYKNTKARKAFQEATEAAWRAYRIACDEGVSYQDARYALPEATTNYILCEYSVREFLAVYAYRACSMFLWEMVDCMRKMGDALGEAHPFLKPYIKISCEKSAPNTIYEEDGGEQRYSHRCTFQGWESVEGQCDKPWARQDNRVFLPLPKNRIGG